MKNLLIPTNFSDISRHATDYAIDLFKSESLSIHLLHTYEQPKMGRTIHISLTDVMKKNADRGLNEDELRIKEKYPNSDIKINKISVQGELSGAIKSALQKLDIDLVIMGSKGNQELVDMFIESETARVIRNVDHAMLIVPPIAKLNGLKSIILATDRKPISSEKIVHPLISLCKENQVGVRVLHISKDSANEDKENESRLSQLLGGIEHDFNYRKDSDIPRGIYKFLYETDADIVTLVKRKGQGKLVDRFFSTSVSKRIVKHVRQTLLLLSDQDYA